MNPSEIFIKRPVTTILLMLGLLVFGTLAYRELPVSDLPAIDFPTIQVSGSLPGASPETVATSRRAAARKTVRDDRRPADHQLDQRPGHRPTSRCSSI